MIALIDGDRQKYCSKCQNTKPVSSFSYDKHSKDGRSYWCKPCAAANSRKNHKLRAQNNPKYKDQKRSHYFKDKYGITLQEYEEKLAQQDNVCAICGVKLSTNGPLTHLDHDHKTGKLRSFLCTNCNRGLGHFKDNPELLIKASNYLSSHNQNVDLIKEENINDRTH